MNAATETTEGLSAPAARRPRRPDRSTGRCAANCGRAARCTSRRWWRRASSCWLSSSMRSICRQGIKQLAALDPERQRAAVSAVFFGVALRDHLSRRCMVSFFYCLDALYGERRDRSILFWKSMPVSDLTVVLIKTVHGAGGRCGDRVRRHHRRRSCCSCAEHGHRAVQRREPGADLEQSADVPAHDRSCCTRSSRCRCGTRRSAPGCCWCPRGRSARRSCGRCCRRCRDRLSNASRSAVSHFSDMLRVSSAGRAAARFDSSMQRGVIVDGQSVETGDHLPENVLQVLDPVQFFSQSVAVGRPRSRGCADRGDSLDAALSRADLSRTVLCSRAEHSLQCRGYSLTAASQRVRSDPCMSRLVCVSNRISLPRKSAAPGGLAVGVLSALKRTGGLWFGWGGETIDRSRAIPTFTFATASRTRPSICASANSSCTTTATRTKCSGRCSITSSRACATRSSSAMPTKTSIARSRRSSCRCSSRATSSGCTTIT